jgi:geranylgeranyl diphosphate synthase, type II
MNLNGSAPFLDYSKHVLGEVEHALDGYTQTRDGLPEPLREAIRHSLLAPCKRLRPLLVLMAAEACGKNRSEAMPAACAVEMIHTYSLIHDDLPAMDDDDLRRGRPSCHAMFGESTAILAGDALLARAFEVSSSEIEDSAAALRCTQLLATAAGETALVGGQFDDLSTESLRNDLSRNDLEHLKLIHARKTGALFRVSLLLGGVVGGGSTQQMAALEQYGKELGLAFQVVDDLLDLLGNEQDMGKRTGKDSELGKLTFPGLMGVEASREYAAQLVAKAIESIAEFGERASELGSLAHFVFERTR